MPFYMWFELADYFFKRRYLKYEKQCKKREYKKFSETY